MKPSQIFYLCRMIKIVNASSKFSIALLLVVLLASCASKENILYLQDVDKNLTKETLVYEPLIQNDDLLTISVTSVDLTSVAIYNQNLFVDRDGNMMVNPRQELPGYLVDGNGEILFLQLGKLKVTGKTRIEVMQMITEKLEKYVVDPVVDVRIANFKVTVIGEVVRPGTFNITGNRVSLTQALGLAGDLTIFGDRKNVLLLRDENGVQITKTLDLTNTSFINSDSYFLQQNDIIIVSPNNTRVQGSKFNQNAPLFVSIASLLLTVVLIIVTTNRN